MGSDRYFSVEEWCSGRKGDDDARCGGNEFRQSVLAASIPLPQSMDSLPLPKDRHAPSNRVLRHPRVFMEMDHIADCVMTPMRSPSLLFGVSLQKNAASRAMAKSGSPRSMLRRKKSVAPIVRVITKVAYVCGRPAQRNFPHPIRTRCAVPRRRGPGHALFRDPWSCSRSAARAQH